MSLQSLTKKKKTKFEKSIAERTKLKKQKSDKQPDTKTCLNQKVKNLLYRIEINKEKA